MNATAVITAGGTGTRIGNKTPKQFLPLLGIPMIVRTARSFERCSMIEKIVVTLPKNELRNYPTTFFQKHDLRKIVRVVEGGKTRQESVHCALRAIEWPCNTVAIHDAARPLITPEMISEGLQALDGWDGAITALAIRDTIKEVKETPKIDRTLSREKLWAMQTPQMFRFPYILEAYDRAEKETFKATDDAQVAEHFGGKIRVVEGRSRNFKITLPEDWTMAEAILKETDHE